MQDVENRLYSVPMYGTVVPMDHGGHDMGVGVTDKMMIKPRQRITDPSKMVIDLEWLSDIKVPLMEAHDQLGGYGGLYCYIYI